MEALSVAASIANLIQLAQVIGSTVYRLHQGAAEAPDSARRLRDELTAIKNVLYEVERFVNDQTLSEHGVHVSIRNFLEVVSDCLLTFSALDHLIEELASDNSGLIPRMRWALKERDVGKWTERLVRHQNILNLMLGISQLRVTSSFQADIRKLTTELTAMKSDIINSQLSTRVEERLTSYNYATGSLIPAESRTSHDDGESVQSSSSRPSRSYSAALRQSMVYRRVRWRSSRQTLSDYDTRSTASNMTVGEASNLSAYAVPLYPNEVSNALSSLSTRPTRFRSISTTLRITNPPPFSPDQVVQAQIFELPAEPVDRSLPPIPGDPGFLREVVISAATSGNDDIVFRLVPFIKSLTDTEQGTLTTQLLHLAISNQRFEVVRILLTSANANVNSPDSEGRLAINHAVRLGSFPLISTLLWEYPQGSLIARTDSLGRNAIHDLVLSRHPSPDTTAIFKLLLSHSPKALNGLDTSGESPLHLAVACADTALVKIMLHDYSANINIRNSADQLPLQIALESDLRNTNSMKEIVHELVHKHSRPDIATITTTSIRKGWGVATLGKAGADFSTIDPETGRPALHTAIHYGKIRSAKVLIDNFDESPYSLTAEGYTVLHEAATCEASVDVDRLIRWLVQDRKVPVDWAGHRLDTPLLWAVKMERQNAARTLLDLGANVFVRDKEGRTAREIAIEKRQIKLAEVLLEREGIVGKNAGKRGAEWTEFEEEDGGVPDDAEPGMVSRIWVERRDISLRPADWAGPGPHRAATVVGGENWKPWGRSQSPAIRAPGRNQSAPDTFFSPGPVRTPTWTPSPPPFSPPQPPSQPPQTMISHHLTSSPGSTKACLQSAPPRPPKIPDSVSFTTRPNPIPEFNSSSINFPPATPPLSTVPESDYSFNSPRSLRGSATSSIGSLSPTSSAIRTEDESDITDPEDEYGDEVEVKKVALLTLELLKLDLDMGLGAKDDWAVGIIDEALTKVGQGFA